MPGEKITCIIEDLQNAPNCVNDGGKLPEEEEQRQQINVRIETLKDFVDTERITNLLNEGNIIFLKTKDIQRHDLGEFQNCVQKLKRNSAKFGWDIVGLEEGYLVLTPKFARIERQTTAIV
jgi:SepF-like predicted cell division protein (DUF552 family)